MGIRERLQEIADEMGSQTALAIAAGVSKGRVTQWLQGDVKDLSATSALKIEENSNYLARWLIFGKGPKKLDAKTGTVAHTLDSKQKMDEEKLLAIIKIWQETGKGGKEAIWAGAQTALKKRATARHRRQITASPDSR